MTMTITLRLSVVFLTTTLLTYILSCLSEGAALPHEPSPPPRTCGSPTERGRQGGADPVPPPTAPPRGWQGSVGPLTGHSP